MALYFLIKYRGKGYKWKEEKGRLRRKIYTIIIIGIVNNGKIIYEIYHTIPGIELQTPLVSGFVLPDPDC